MADQRQGLLFFGTMAASLSHEMRNALATVSETSGLMADIMEMAAEEGNDVDPEKLRSLCQRIATQSKRAAGLAGRLNAFAHTVDEEHAAVDLHTHVALAVDLNRRKASLERVDLDKGELADGPEITCDPFALHLLLHQVFMASVRRCGTEAKLQVDLEPSGDIRIRGLAEKPEGLPESLARAALDLGFAPSLESGALRLKRS
jgi:signal transduction histidine kinase